MNLDEILHAAGPHKKRRRIGRGPASGQGKTAGRGSKGAGQHSSRGKRWGFQGGTNPMLARIPKRGFSNAQFRQEYQIVNVDDLERFEPGTRVDAAALLKARLIGDLAEPIKVLGRGDLTRQLTVVAAKFSTTAAEKIAKAGGTAEKV